MPTPIAAPSSSGEDEGGQCLADPQGQHQQEGDRPWRRRGCAMPSAGAAGGEAVAEHDIADEQRAVRKRPNRPTGSSDHRRRSGATCRRPPTASAARLRGLRRPIERDADRADELDRRDQRDAAAVPAPGRTQQFITARQAPNASSNSRWRRSAGGQRPPRARHTAQRSRPPWRSAARRRRARRHAGTAAPQRPGPDSGTPR